MADELVERIYSLLPRFADPDELHEQDMPATAELVVIAPVIAARIQSDAAEIARLKAELAEARGKVTALEASLHAHNCGTPGCLCISTAIRDLAGQYDIATGDGKD